MLIFALDDERLMLEALKTSIREAEPSAELRGFQRSSAALKSIAEEGLRPDVIFLDIEMPGPSGLELAKRIKELSPRTNLVFVTGFSQYALEAHALWPSGYLMKPVSARKIRAELDNLRHPVKAPEGRRLRARCFGSFELFANGEPLRFRYAKTKELLAYLVDRNGSAADTSELCAILWEDREDTVSLRNQLRNLLSDLRRALRAAGAEELLRIRRNCFAVNPDMLDCDYYRLLAGEAVAVNAFAGEYMQQYSWAEARVGLLMCKV